LATKIFIFLKNIFVPGVTSCEPSFRSLQAALPFRPFDAVMGQDACPDKAQT